MINRKYIDFKAPLTAEQIARIDALAKKPDEDIVFDEDCPELTEEQLGRMKRVNSLREKTTA